MPLTTASITAGSTLTFGFFVYWYWLLISCPRGSCVSPSPSPESPSIHNRSNPAKGPLYSHPKAKNGNRGLLHQAFRGPAPFPSLLLSRIRTSFFFFLYLFAFLLLVYCLALGTVARRAVFCPLRDIFLSHCLVDTIGNWEREKEEQAGKGKPIGVTGVWRRILFSRWSSSYSSLLLFTKESVEGGNREAQRGRVRERLVGGRRQASAQEARGATGG